MIFSFLLEKNYFRLHISVQIGVQAKNMALFDTQEGLFFRVFVTRSFGGAEESRTLDPLLAK